MTRRAREIFEKLLYLVETDRRFGKKPTNKSADWLRESVGRGDSPENWGSE